MFKTKLFIAVLFICFQYTLQYSDELDKHYEISCAEIGSIPCTSGGCFQQSQFCDGFIDCDDGSDEQFCVTHKTDPMICNATHQFLCANGLSCIPNFWICNNRTDCDDGSDEANCTDTLPIDKNATCKGFVCDNGKCISDLWVCDGIYDCKDKSDEFRQDLCHSAKAAHMSLVDTFCYKVPISGVEHAYKCLDWRYCVTASRMCDGILDCRDESDEGNFCYRWNTMCDQFQCYGNNTKCVPDREGPICVCDPDTDISLYNYDTHKCEDVDECIKDIPQCSHKCINLPRNFRCECEPGYTMDHLRYLCFAPAPEGKLFFSTPNDIRYLTIMTKQMVTVASGIKKAHGVTFDGTYVYWVETAKGHQAIFKARLDNIKDSKQILAGLGLEEPDSIAIDYLGDNIYFSDSERGTISACKSDGSICTTIKAKTNHPTFVTLDVRNGLMYWADYMGRGVILTARMDGSHTEVLVDQLESFATGLALDVPNDRLYYVDKTIRVVILSLRRGYTLLDEPYHHPYSISVFENTIYWNDWTTNTIQMTDKVHGTAEMRHHLLKLNTSITGMHMYHPILMNATINPCKDNICSHFCFVTSNTTHVCGCPDGMELKNNSCARIGYYRAKYLVVGEGRLFTRIQYDELGNPESHATSFNIGRVQAMTYDRVRDLLYIYDVKFRSIQYISMNDFLSGMTQPLVQEGLVNVVDLGFDFASDNLYILDAGRRVIEVYSSKLRKRAEVYKFGNEETPISFCLMPDYGRMMVAVVETEQHNNIHIDSMGLDGRERRHVISNNLKGPHIRLRYVQQMDNVYIADESNGVIDYFHPDGKGKENYRELATTVYSLAVTENLVFWTDRRTPRVFWADIHDTTQKIRRMDLSIFPNNTQLLIEATMLIPGDRDPLWDHPCISSNICLDVCVQMSHEDQYSPLVPFKYRCLCSPGYALQGSTCVKVVHCREDQVTCHRSNACIPKEKICNQVNDCPLGEDEEGCTPVNVDDICTPDEFFCGGVCLNRKRTSMCNGKPISKTETKSICSISEYQCANSSICISRSQLCDKKTDCPSGDDELFSKCDTLSCYDSEFMCASGSCISKTFVCDGEEDCNDGSDESNCGNVRCGPGFFQCRSRDCIESKGRCDGKQDCLDFSDEEDCEEPIFVETTEQKPHCAPWEYSCEHNTSICLPRTARCNKSVECPGGSDENGCDHGCASSGLFACIRQMFCISMRQVCNNKRDCYDGSDETPEACNQVNRTSTIFPSSTWGDCTEGFRCADGQCIEWLQVCDNNTDCLDNSDENGKCLTSCVDDKCEFECQPTPTGPHCSCKVGYNLRADNFTCEDIDECQEEVCSQICLNTPGSFSCSCHRGYAPRPDRRSCKSIKGRMSILYAAGNTVRSLAGNGTLRVEFNDDQIPTISDMDMDVRKNILYLSVPEANKLLEVTAARDVIAVTNIGKPTRVTLDWVTGNVYFVDNTPSAKRIRVCHIIKMRCAMLQKLPSDANVTALIVDPSSHRMFYCLTRELESVVWSASLTGAHVTDLTTVRNCTGLAVDQYAKKLYVAESGPGHIIRMDYEGDSHKKILAYKPQLRGPQSLAIFEDHIYYLEANSVSLSRCLIFGHKHCDSYSYRFSNANSFVIRHENMQRDELIIGCEGFTCPGICALDEFGPKCICYNGQFAAHGQCPDTDETQLPLFNGQPYKESIPKLTAFGSVFLTVFILSGLVGIAYLLYRHNLGLRAAAPYAEVRFHNRNDSPSGSRDPSIQFGEAGAGTPREFVNPIQIVKNVIDILRRQDTPERSSDLEIIVPTSPPQPDLSDTESDLDDKESNRIMKPSF